MPDDSGKGSSPSDRIRDAGKWLIGASAAVGAALIAGSQLSDIGNLPLCSIGSATCLRLPLAVLGAAVALTGISYVMWRAVQLLLPVEVTITELISNWEITEGWDMANLSRAQKRTLGKMPEIHYFRTNPDQINNGIPQELLEARRQRWEDYDSAQKALRGLNAKIAGGPSQDPAAGPGQAAEIRSEARSLVTSTPLSRLRSLLSSRHRAARSGASTARESEADEPVDSQVVAGKGAVDVARLRYERARDDVRALVTMAQFQRLLASFRAMLGRLLAATVVTAIGITVFAWASNPGTPSSNLGGASLVGANLSGVDLSQATLDGADLSDANLSGARLDGASLTDVVWSNTTCPDGTSSDANQPATCLGHLGR